MADSFNPTMHETAARFEAWWHGDIIDRPPVSLRTTERRPGGPPDPVEPSDDTLRRRDIKGVVDRAVTRMMSSYFLGDTIPQFWANLGPVITSAWWGAEMKFAPSTVWCDPIYHDVSKWHDFLKTPPNFDVLDWQIVEKMTDYALSIADGRYVVGVTDLHGNYDILAALRGNEEICVDMMEEPELVAAAAMHAARGFNEGFRRQWKQISAKQKGCSCWTPMYHAGPCFVPSCDFWCMVSPQMGRELVLPSIREEIKLLERSIFHLDGPGALPQLQALLDTPELGAVQWLYGAGAGPAAKWIDVYRRIIAAKKSLQLIAMDAEDAMKVLAEIGTERVWVSIEKPFPTARSANDFLKDIQRFSQRKDGPVKRV